MAYLKLEQELSLLVIRNDITEKVGLNFMTIQNVFPEPNDKIIPLKEALEGLEYDF